MSKRINTVVIKNAGDECFVRFDDGTYAWKGL